jgi:hypothetical protein
MSRWLICSVICVGGNVIEKVRAVQLAVVVFTVMTPDQPASVFSCPLPILKLCIGYVFRWYHPVGHEVKTGWNSRLLA